MCLRVLVCVRARVLVPACACVCAVCVFVRLYVFVRRVCVEYFYLIQHDAFGAIAHGCIGHLRSARYAFLVKTLQHL